MHIKCILDKERGNLLGFPFERVTIKHAMDLIQCHGHIRYETIEKKNFPSVGNKESIKIEFII